MGKMSEDEVRTFMRFGSRTGKLATVRPDGSPHVVPVWFGPLLVDADLPPVRG